MVFDLDGTLVDSRADIAASTNAALRAVGLPERSLAEISTFIGEGSRRLLERAIAPRADLLEAASTCWASHYAAHLLDRTVPYPGIRELLDRLGPPLAVHTNKPEPFARAIVQGLGLERHFQEIVGARDGGPRKPNPEDALGLLERLGVPPASAAYVGDSRIDVATARAAGIRFLGVAWGLGGEAELRAAGATELFRDAPSLLRALRGAEG
ncbi:MAG: HAD family hydrolase [Deltaproteobacteria bacterium]